MLYSDFANITSSTSDDADSSTANITMNGQAQRILYVWSQQVDQTRTAAEGKQSSVFLTGDFHPGSPRPLIPSGNMRGSSLGSTIDQADAPVVFYPVDWETSPNGVIAVGVRGIGGTAAELATVGLVYSDGEGHPPIGGWNAHGLRAPPKYVISTDDTAISNSTTETALAAVTVPGNARTCLGLGIGVALDGVLVTAEEQVATVRWTATGAGEHFEPAQQWPIPGFGADAGLSTVIHGGNGGPVEFMPLEFTVVPNSTLTPNITFRTAVTNNVQFRGYAAFA